jgi:uncharacterized protein YuzE
MKLTWDSEADALYLTLRGDEEPISRTEELDAGTLVDVDRFGHVIGIEVLRPAREWPLEDILSRYELTEEDRLSLKVMFERSRKDRPFPFAKPLVIA